MTEPVDNASLGQADYMKLFMQELTYQDPLKPVDNREFMAQMAQFSLLQQSTTTNQALEQLLNLSKENQAVSLLGKEVQISNTNEYGTVTSVFLNTQQVPEIRVKIANKESVKVSLEHVSEVVA